VEQEDDHTRKTGPTKLLSRNLDYTYRGISLKVRNIVEATAGHIHCGPVGVNCPVGVTLFTGESFSGNFTLQGTITAPDDGNGCGWEKLAVILDAIENGGAYVNVHPFAHATGEIRGQVMAIP